MHKIYYRILSKKYNIEGKLSFCVLILYPFKMDINYFQREDGVVFNNNGM